jgi:hypothetical protein
MHRSLHARASPPPPPLPQEQKAAAKREKMEVKAKVRKDARSRMRSGDVAPEYTLADCVEIGQDTVQGHCYVTVPKHIAGTFVVLVEATTVAGEVVTCTSDDVVIEDGACDGSVACPSRPIVVSCSKACRASSCQAVGC